MKLVVLGSDGQLGSDVVSANASRAHPSELIAFTKNDFDLTDPAKTSNMLEALEFDAVINCTGLHNVDKIEVDATSAFALNTTASQHLARICASKNAKYVYISSDYVYGGYCPARPFTEADRPAPVNVYGASKQLGETLSLLAHSETTVFRIASLFGVAGEYDLRSNFVETIIKRATETGKLRVVNDQFMSPTNAADAAEWILKCLESSAPAGIYHAVNSGGTTWYNFAKTIVEMCGISASVVPIPSTSYPMVAKRPAYSALDNSKLAGVVGSVRCWEEAIYAYLVSKEHIAG